jgi:signal transduction histidine kinase/CheY-like chemotaxis protein
MTTETKPLRSTEALLARYIELFDLAPIGYVTLAGDGAIDEINRAGAEILRRPRHRLVGTTFTTYLDAASLPRFATLLGNTLDDAPPLSCDLRIAHAAGVTSVRARVAAIPGGGPVLLAFEDAQSEHALREANRRKDDFIAMISHELRNPLSPIRTSISVLQAAAPGSNAAVAALDILDRSTAHLTRLVDDLLDVTRIARRTLELHRELLDLGDLLRRTVEGHRPELETKGIELRFEEAAGQASVYGDRSRLAQVFGNVLDNAGKFTQRGGRVEVSVMLGHRTASIRVRDNGAGIAPGLLERAFDPFIQAPQSLDRPHGGLGLGLALVKSVVEQHGGQVTIDSPGAGRGTEVTIVLPAEQSRVEQVAHTQARADQPRRVLVVEDKLDAAEALRFALSLKGHHVEIVCDGRTAVAHATEHIPDVVLCDLGLPDIDGYEVARALRSHRQLESVCLIALSGYARPEDVSRAHEAGFDRHLAKPPRLEELFQLLASAKAR